MTLSDANKAEDNVGEVLRGNERPQGATDLAKTEPRRRRESRRRSIYRLLGDRFGNSNIL